MKKIFYIALTAVLGLAGTSCDREKLTYDSEPGEISGKTGTLDLSSFDAQAILQYRYSARTTVVKRSKIIGNTAKRPK